MDLSKATAVILSYPVLTIVLSALFKVEHVQMYQIFGLVCSLSGAYWITLLVKKRAIK